MEENKKDVKENTDAEENATAKENTDAEENADVKNNTDAKDEPKVQKKAAPRKIRQVALSDDGLRKTVVDEREIKNEDDATEEAIKRQTEKELEEAEIPDIFTEWDPDDTRMYDPAIHKHHEIMEEESRKRKSRKIVRLAAVIVAFTFSVIFAAGMGVVLALWDSGSSVAELRGILMPGTVKVAANETYGETEYGGVNSDFASAEGVSDISESDTNEPDINETDTNETDTDEPDISESDTEKVDAKEAESSDSDDYAISDVEVVAKAGEDDELMSNPIGEVVSVQYVDPNENYPLDFTSVDESYFTDALFIGDSRLQGFGIWSGLPATFYCATGFQLYQYETTKVVQTDAGKVPIFDALPYDKFTKIYIKVGLNEMGWGNESKFEALYAEVIDKLRQMEPRAVIYIHGLLPVTAEKSATDGSHNNVNIEERNNALKEFAVTQKAYFVDAGSALKGPDGCLPSEMTGDGIHLKAGYMPVWKQYLQEHAVLVR